MLTLCTAEGPHSQHVTIPVNSLVRKCQIQSTIQKKKKTDYVQILFYTSRTTGQSYLHAAVQISFFHVLYRHHCKTFSSTSLNTTKVWAQPEFIWFLCCINFWSQRVLFICSPPLIHVAHATVASYQLFFLKSWMAPLLSFSQNRTPSFVVTSSAGVAWEALIMSSLEDL